MPAGKWGRNPLNLDSPPHVRWTTVNAGEVMPGVMTPLGATLFGDHAEAAGKKVFYRLGALTRQEAKTSLEPERRVWGVFYGRSAINVNLMRRIGDRMPGSSGDAIEEQLFGESRSSEPSRPEWRRYPVAAARLVPAMAPARSRVARIRIANETWWRQSTAMSPDGLAGAVALLVEARDRFEEAMEAHVMITMIAQGVYERVVALIRKSGWTDGTELDLLTGYGSMEETTMLGDLWQVAHGTLTIAMFLDRHGYHGGAEAEVASRSWREDPRQLDPLMESFRGLPAERAPEAVERAQSEARQAAEDSLLAALPRWKRPSARALLRLARKYIPMREVGKAAFLQAVDVFRSASRAVGRELADRGVLDDPEDVFYLTVDELTGVVPDDAPALVAERRGIRDEYVDLDIPQTWTGNPAPFSSGTVGLDLSGADPGQTVSGMGVSGGQAEGVVRVIDTPESAAIDEGEILVCNTTDPSWAPVLFLAGALVINVGGALSHGAIIARELGVPCVINTIDGTTRLHDGDVVRVDGTTGIVTVLQPAGRTAPAGSRSHQGRNHCHADSRSL